MRAPKRIEHQGVEGLRVGRWGAKINTTAIVYRLGAVYVDAGPPNQWGRVRSWARERPPEHVVLTHHHEDHSGNAARLARTFGAQVWAPAASLPRLAHGWRMAAFQHFYWGRPRRLEARPVEARLEVGGEVLVPIPAPGHAEDMTVYLAPERGILFSGDLYIVSRPTHLRFDEDVSVQIESLRRVLAHDFETVLCTHRGVVREGRAALEAKLDYLVSLRERARDLARQGHDLDTITRVLLGRETAESFVTRGDFTKHHLVASCLAAEG